jgi:hypothetical protein
MATKKKKQDSIQVVINTKFGGFNLSDAVIKECVKRGMKLTTFTPVGDYVDPDADFVDWGDDNRNLYRSQYTCCRGSNTNAFRTNPILISAIRKLGIELSSGRHCELKIVTIPFKGTEGWHIDEYDGSESIREDHREWS